MNQYAELLLRSASEVREFLRNSPEAHSFGVVWLESLASRLEVASSIGDSNTVQREILAIAYSINDSAPLSSGFAPSFDIVLDALQRSKKRGSG
jgi:hypothetical protein